MCFMAGLAVSLGLLCLGLDAGGCVNVDIILARLDN